MTEKELISKIQTLKSIKPKEDWVILTKSNILSYSEKVESGTSNQITNGYLANLLQRVFKLSPLKLSPQRKLAYSFATLLILFVGALGLAWYSLPAEQPIKFAQQSPGVLENNILASIQQVKEKSQELALTQKGSLESPVVKKAMKAALDDLAQSVKEKPQAAKDVALEIKNSGVLAVITETEDEDLAEASLILNKTLAEQMINDLEQTILTEEQESALLKIKELFKEGNYSASLEAILLINE